MFTKQPLVNIQLKSEQKKIPPNWWDF